MNRLTVRTAERDVGGDTVLFEDDALVVLGSGTTERVSLAAVNSVIAGEPAAPEVDTGP